MEHGALTFVLAVVAGGFVAQWLAWRLRLPAIALMLLVGFLVGPVFQLFDPSEMMGEAFGPVIGYAVAIIVFEGGLNLDLRELRAAGQGVLRLTVVTLPINFALGALAGWAIGGLDWPIAMLFGAIIVVTGPTVILPLLRQARLKPRPASVLKWEAIVNDPIGAILAVLILEIMLVTAGRREAGQEEVLGLAAALIGGIVIALALGFGAAILAAWAFRRDLMPERLKIPLLITLVLSMYGLANLVMEESGLIAATVFGVALANLRVPGVNELRRFNEGLVVLIVSGLFVVLTADLDLAQFRALEWPIAALALAVLFLVRPAATMLATSGSDLGFRERVFLAWIGPRGIVAAAVAGIASIRLEAAGYAGADIIQSAVFSIIAITILANGFTLAPLAKRLGLSAGDSPGIVIVGASDWSADLAALLKRLDVPVLMVDSFNSALQTVRKRGIPCLQMEVLSEDAEIRLAGRPVDYLLAATADEIYNALVCTRLAPDLGRERVYQVAPRQRRMDGDSLPSPEWRGKTLGHQTLRYSDLDERYRQGWRFLAVNVDEQKSLDDLTDARRIPIIILRKTRGLRIASPEQVETSSARAGDKVVLFAQSRDAVEPIGGALDGTNLDTKP